MVVLDYFGSSILFLERKKKMYICVCGVNVCLGKSQVKCKYLRLLHNINVVK